MSEGHQNIQLPYYSPPQAGYGQQNTPVYTTPPYGGGTEHNTTVIVQQPTGPGAPGAAPRMWTTGVMDCCDDMSICCAGCCCGGGLAMKVASDMGESGCVPCCVPGALIAMRVKWRTQENIHGTILDDCFTLWCCGPCGLCQLAREVKRKRAGTLRPLA